MHRIVTGATGLIGHRLVSHWLAQGHTITVIGRTQSHIKAVFGDRVRSLTWDALSSDVLQSAELVVNLAGANLGERRLTSARKQIILSSRTETTGKIARLLATMGSNAPPLFSASAIGIYGLQKQVPNGLPDLMDENTVFNWDDVPDFLAQVGRAWEQAALPAVQAGVRVVFLRFGVVLAKEGGALPKLLTPFRFYLGGVLGSGNQPFSWVAIDDLISAIDFLYANRTLSGPFNIVAPQCVTQRALAKTLGQVLGRPAAVKMPAFLLELMMGKEMARDLLLEGQHVYPTRLLDAGFQFKYPDLKSAFQQVLSS